MEALTAARFGLQWQEHPPGNSKTGGGYLGLSHDQNLKVWFDDQGMTVRPTLSEEKRDQAWSTVVRLTAYGYGKQLVDIPPIVSRMVKANRIEYERVSSNRQSPIRNSQLVEWYENRAEGIEQGFTLNQPPERNGGALNEPLRVLLAVTGDLRARPKGEGTIALNDARGNGALSYSKLVAQDADGKKLAARMEASADGREIALLVEDEGARYPIVIDPVMASLEKKLDATPNVQLDARFGFAVAIEGDTAVVGAWREDSGALADVGVVYIFSRSGSSWTLSSRNNSGTSAGDACGESVAISRPLVVYGCPGANNNTGRAFVRDLSTNGSAELLPPFGMGLRNTGDRYGASVAISNNQVIVGEPLNDSQGTDSGIAFQFTLESGLSYADPTPYNGASGDQFGTSVAIDGDTFVVGAPGFDSGSGKAVVLDVNSSSTPPKYLYADDRAASDNFGQSVAISGNTAVVGAPLNSEKGSSAGAAYVFVRDTSRNWSQQQKLTGSDATAGNFFGASHIAIQGNTIVAGAYGYSYFDLNKGTIQNAGEAYIFMRSGTVWTEQAITVGDNQAGDEFGIGLGISGNTVIVGARHATAAGTAGAGATFVYRLACVPPYGSIATGPTTTACPGSLVNFILDYYRLTTGTPSFQWRKNGVNIPGETSELYTINSASASDAGSYDVVVSTSCGSDTSNPVTLAVYAFSLNPTSQNFGVSGSTGIVNVTATSASCSWTAVSNASFITVNSGSSGTGNGTVGFTVASNPDSAQRIGTLTIAGQSFTVSQDGTQCSYLIAPTSQNLGASASTNTVNVTASAGCAWTATSNDPFLSINSGASGSGNGTVTYTIAANPTTSQRTGTLTVAGQTFTVTQGGASVLANISTRLRVETGNNVLIGGFIVTGTQSKKVMIRAIGPSLPFADDLADPILELHDSSGALLDSNDNWVDSPNKQAIIDSTIAPTNDLESAIVATLPANGSGYTAIVRGVNNGTGIGVVEAYDLDRTVDSKLANISTRGLVQTGDDVLIAGTIVVGQAPQKVLVEALGPSLSVPGKLEDPILELRDVNGTLLDSNDNWVDSPNKQAIIDTTIPPSNDLESAIIATLPAGGAQYTAIVRGVNGTTGVAVVEVFALN